ncbi:MAG: cbb3-type cytochrome oxidase assembly protein CcoS [Paracoccaceae bacterium]
MNVLVVLIPVSLLLGTVGLVAFVWTVRSDQYDDDQGNAARILLDDECFPEATDRK